MEHHGRRYAAVDCSDRSVITTKYTSSEELDRLSAVGLTRPAAGIENIFYYKINTTLRATGLLTGYQPYCLYANCA